MLNLAQQVAAEFDLLYSLYQLALECAQKIKPSPEEGESLEKWLHTRQRILTRAELSIRKIKLWICELQTTSNFSLSEKAMIEEKKQLIQDLSLKMLESENSALRRIQVKLQSLRQELAGHNTKKSAIPAYHHCPKPLALVA